MPTIATFLDTKLPQYAQASKALVAQGWKLVRNTASNRKTILLKYYEYLVNTSAQKAGINPALITPEQLQPFWDKANAEYEKYEMYVKEPAVVEEDVAMGAAGAPQVAAEEIFITNQERIDLAYADIEDVLSAFGAIKLSGPTLGGKRRHNKHTRRHSKPKKHTKRCISKRRHTRRK